MGLSAPCWEVNIYRLTSHHNLYAASSWLGTCSLSMALQGPLDIDGVKVFPQDEKWERSKECILKLNTHLTFTYTQKGGFLSQTLWHFPHCYNLLPTLTGTTAVCTMFRKRPTEGSTSSAKDMREG